MADDPLSTLDTSIFEFANGECQEGVMWPDMGDVMVVGLGEPSSSAADGNVSEAADNECSEQLHELAIDQDDSRQGL